MQITFTPIRSDEAMTVSVSGDVLTLNGQTADFGFLNEGDTIPASAVNSPWIVGREIKKESGEIHIMVCVPYPGGVALNETVSVSSGAVNLPTWSQA